MSARHLAVGVRAQVNGTVSYEGTHRAPGPWMVSPYRDGLPHPSTYDPSLTYFARMMRR